jgi:hypothetical protein
MFALLSILHGFEPELPNAEENQTTDKNCCQHSDERFHAIGEVVRITVF